MTDREDFRKRARVERTAALNAPDMPSFHAHMALAREYEWRAMTEYPDPTAPG